jgi:outer membrane protein TolC
MLRVRGLSRTKGPLVLRNRALIVAALADLRISLIRIESEVASAVSEVDEVLRQLEQSHTHISRMRL